MNPLLTPNSRDTLDTKSVRLLVLGDGELSGQQRAELNHKFFIHKMNVRTAAGSYLVHNGKLSDGTPFRFISNSGQHQVMVWPVPGEPRTPLKSLFFSVPYSAGFTSPYEPKVSTIWPFRGATEPPEKLHKARVVEDATKLRQHPGNLTWYSADLTNRGKPITASWYGRATRYGRLDYYGRNVQWTLDGFYSTLYSPSSSYRDNWFDAFKPAVWLNGVKRRVATAADAGDLDVRVISCGLKHVDGEGLYLYVITKDTTLAVYRGLVGDPYRPSTIRVEHVFDIDFTVDTTPLSGLNPHWESLMQPPFFNASCTEVAGLVSVRMGSTVNVTAAAAIPGTAVTTLYFAVLMQIDLEAQTTSFDTSHSSYESAVPVDTHTGVMSTSEARDITETFRRIEYSAVDFEDDQLVIAMVDRLQTVRQEQTGSWTQTAAWKNGEKYVSGGYRIYREYDDFTFAEREFEEVHTGTFYAEASAPGIGSSPSTGSGFREEDLSADMLRAVTVEGGDLRHGLVVVGEILEVGDSYFYDTIGENGIDAWHPGHRDGSVPFDYSSMTRTAVTTDFARHDALRFSVWLAGVEQDTTDYNLAPSYANRSAFGWLEAILTNSPEATATQQMYWFNWSQLYIPDTNFNQISLGAFETKTALNPSGTPHYSCGAPYINVAAAASDGSAMFYQVMGGWVGTGSVTIDDVGAWILDDTSYPLDADLYFPAANHPSLSSPVFIDNVPLQEPTP